MCNADESIVTKRQHNNMSNNVKKSIPLFPARDPTALALEDSFVKSIFDFGMGILVGVATLLFSLWFPFVMAPHAATETYISAGYSYSKQSFFDNSAWTYGTDYFLVLVMGTLSYQLKTNSSSLKMSQQLRFWGCALLGLYAVSTLAGGLAHQFYHTVESRNTWLFTCLWIVCVGTVSLAGGVMGCCGTKLVRGFGRFASLTSIPTVSEWFWIGFGVLQFAACAFGCISYQRPACDIFIAGTTQFPSTLYVVMALWLRKFPKQTTRLAFRIMGYIGFLWNAPLLPMYPLLIQYTSWSLAQVNTFLHGWLLVGWSLQGMCLLHCCRAMETLEEKQSRTK